MSNEIKRADAPIDRTFEGKRVRTSKAQLSKIIAPIFAAFPGVEMPDATFNAYHMMLSDLDPDKLAAAVIRACQAHKYPTQLITVAAIREAYDAMRRPPGPHSEVDPMALPPAPQRMFRLDPEEDYQQRMERLRQTRGWDKYYHA